MEKFRSRLLATTLLVGASLPASPVLAQTAPPADPADTAQPDSTAPAAADPAAAPAAPSSQDIVITGTRIPQPNLTSASPVTVLSSQDIKLQGTTRTEDLINSLPQSFGAQGSNISNGALGIASVNLRGLGPTRTLVLVNGRRLQPGDPRVPLQDINFIPSPIVKRVDVLTGGASSVYGADAVAGVVNFIMDTGFTGLKIDAQASTFMHYNDVSDAILNANVARGFRAPHGWSVNGGAQDISAAFGANFDDGRGHIMAYATYRKQDPVLQASRDYSFCSLAARTAAQGGLGSGTPPRDFNCGGSGTSANGTFFTNVGTFQVGGPNGNQFVPGSTPFNFGPYNFYQRPDERYTLGAFAEYEISPGARPYLEAMFMDDTSNSQIAPSGAFLGNISTINCDNPLLSTQQFNTICVPTNTFVDQNGVTQAIAYVGRRNVEGGGRSDHLNRSSYRIVAGVKGDLLRGLSYDAYYQFGTTRFSQAFQNDFSIIRLSRALDVVANPAVGGVPGVAAGTPVCRAALPGSGPGGGALDVNCVPYNIFSAGAVTPEALGYLQVPLLSRGNVNETIADANFTIDGGEYGVKTPWADRGVGLNVGAEYRKESLDFEPDIEFQSGDGAGQGGAILPVSGKFDVREAFAEIQIPIVEHSFIDEFTLTGGYRYSDYKVAGQHFNTDTYKVEARVAPIPDILARGSYNRAVRAPNVVELFAAQAVALGGTVDSCAGAAVGGLVNGFTATQCGFSGVTAGQFGNINANPANQYNALIGGNPDLAPEKADTYTVNVSYVGTILRKLEIDTGVSGSAAGQDGKFDCAGFYGNTCGSFLSGAPNPKYRHKLRLGLTMPNGLGISGQWRYFSSVKNDALSGDCDIVATNGCVGTVAPANQKIDAQSYFDLAFSARVADKYSFRLGANNVFDKEPPIVGGEVANAPFGNGNTFPQVYDALGRFLFAGVTIDF